MFWEALDKNMTISVAYNDAILFVPFNQVNSLLNIQNSLLFDSMGVITTLSFISDAPL
jgi:hypothetical protein